MSDSRADLPHIEVRFRRLRDVRARALLIRFGFGTTVSAVAGLVSLAYGPRAGGVFLAFPAILLASLTLVAKEQNLPAARDDARGAAVGSAGMFAFAVVCSTVAGVAGGLPALVLASVAWALISVVGYLLLRRLGHGADEEEPTAPSPGQDSNP